MAGHSHRHHPLTSPGTLAAGDPRRVGLPQRRPRRRPARPLLGGQTRVHYVIPDALAVPMASNWIELMDDLISNFGTVDLDLKLDHENN